MSMKEALIEIPVEMVCPIAQADELMAEPVISKCGHTFEKDKILTYLEETDEDACKCPLCKKTITRDDLTPNEVLTQSITDFIKKNPAAIASKYATNKIKNEAEQYVSEKNPIALNTLINDHPEVLNATIFENRNIDAMKGPLLHQMIIFGTTDQFIDGVLANQKGISETRIGILLSQTTIMGMNPFFIAVALKRIDLLNTLAKFAGDPKPYLTMETKSCDFTNIMDILLKSFSEEAFNWLDQQLNKPTLASLLLTHNTKTGLTPLQNWVKTCNNLSPWDSIQSLLDTLSEEMLVEKVYLSQYSLLSLLDFSTLSNNFSISMELHQKLEAYFQANISKKTLEHAERFLNRKRKAVNIEVMSENNKHLEEMSKKMNLVQDSTDSTLTLTNNIASALFRHESTAEEEEENTQPQQSNSPSGGPGLF